MGRHEFRRPLKHRLSDLALAIATGSATAIVVLILAVILADVVIHGFPALSIGFLTSAPRSGMTEGGIFPAIFGTVALVMLMTVAVVPVGVATAIYLHEYAPAQSPITRAVRVAISNLAGRAVHRVRPVRSGVLHPVRGLGHRQGGLRRREGVRPAGADLGGPDPGDA